MILPQGKAAYENLNTSFIDFAELLHDLKANSFTGYVRVSFWQYDGVVFMDSGRIMNAVEEVDGLRSTGPRAVTSVMQRARERDGALGVYALSAEVLTMLVSALRSEVVHKDLNTDFSSLEQLIANLESEGHTGYIEVAVKDGKGDALIFINAGQVVESVFSVGGDVVSGVRVLPHIVDTAAALGAAINVYRASYEEAFGETTEVTAALDLPHLLEVWQEILAAIEIVVDSRVGEHSFLSAFKDSLLDKAEDYPLLDPFAGEFEYKEGCITYTGAALGNLSRGLTDCLLMTLDKVAERTPRLDLLADISEQMELMRHEQGEGIRRFGMEDYISALLVED
jgi:hypothetical protein